MNKTIKICFDNSEKSKISIEKKVKLLSLIDDLVLLEIKEINPELYQPGLPL